ncbi:TetR/AcrR family transcriptional regulator [Patulibacter sp. NPDC049589]|uniref:TetR/AcrR family transcriptional regulator n=1 Tax=Patulibacter sp. NPDC049589 TaxID=3154731 RepID=UPI00343BD1D4
MTETTTPKPLRADARRNREALICAATRTFAEQGVDGSLEEVARRAGVGVGTLYRHFPTRDALLTELLSASFDRLRELSREGLEADDPAQALAEYLRQMAFHSRTFRGVPSSVKLALAESDNPLAASCTATHAGWAELLERAQDAGVVRRDAEPGDVLRLVYGIAWATDNAGDDTALVDRMLGLVLDGLRPAG